MAPRNVLLLTFWLLAAAICVTYVAVRQEPVQPGLSISAQHDDLQRLRDRPLGSWGPYLPRPVLSKEMPRTAIAKAPPLGSEQPVINLSLIHISEPTRLRRISYAVFCLKKKKKNNRKLNVQLGRTSRQSYMLEKLKH